MKASVKPALMTHGGCAAVHPHPRNKTDAELRALVEKDGVFGIYDLFYLRRARANPTWTITLRIWRTRSNVCGEDHVGIGSDASFDVLDLSPEARADWDQCSPPGERLAWPHRKRTECLIRKVSTVPTELW